MAAVSSPQSCRTRSAPPSSSTAFARSRGSITKRSKTGEPEAIWRGEMNRALAAGSQTMTAAAPASSCARRERWTASSARPRARSNAATSGSSSASVPRPARATAAIGSATSFVASEKGPIAMPTGVRPGVAATSAIASKWARCRGRKAASPWSRARSRSTAEGGASKWNVSGEAGLGPDPVHQVGLLEAQVHERDGQGRAVTLGRLPHHAGQAAPIEPNRLGIGTLVEDEVGPDRRAQPGRGERAEVVGGQRRRGRRRGGHARTGALRPGPLDGLRFGAGLATGAFGRRGLLVVPEPGLRTPSPCAGFSASGARRGSSRAAGVVDRSLSQWPFAAAISPATSCPRRVEVLPVLGQQP